MTKSITKPKIQETPVRATWTEGKHHQRETSIFRRNKGHRLPISGIDDIFSFLFKKNKKKNTTTTTQDCWEQNSQAWLVGFMWPFAQRSSGVGQRGCLV